MRRRLLVARGLIHRPRLADTVAVMAAGRIIAQGTPGELIAAHAGREVLEGVRATGPVDAWRLAIESTSHACTALSRPRRLG